MLVPVVLKNGKERSVRKDVLQYLIDTQKVMFFERSDGWAVLGRDKMRHLKTPYEGQERRDNVVLAKDLWY